MDTIAFHYSFSGPRERLRAALCGLAAVFAGAVLARPPDLPPDLPQARANNPVARVETGPAALWFTGLGITGEKRWDDLRADGWVWRQGDERWQLVPPLPPFDGLAGRLGSHAVAMAGEIHVIGGYTVAEDHAERSTPGVWHLETEPPGWRRVATMPVPVDDAVALVHRDRYLYLISGWSNTGNVNLVQVWDRVDADWRQAEPWPGAPVFGHAGGIVDGRLVICGGARIEYPADGARKFVESDECWLGSIRADDLRRLDWKPLPPMPGGPRYRAGAVGAVVDGAPRVIFAGGADRPYNYDGQGYDGVPAEAFASVVSYNLDAGRWECHAPLPEPRMDHRGMLFVDGRLVLLGGMDAGRRVVADAVGLPLSSPGEC